MPLGALDVELVPDIRGLFRSIDRATDNLTATVDVVSHVDVRSASLAAENVEALVGNINAEVVAAANVGSAAIAEETLSAQVGIVTADVVATANLGSAQLAEEALSAEIGTITADVSIDGAGDGLDGATASLDGLTAGLTGAAGAAGPMGLAVAGSIGSVVGLGVAAKQGADLLLGLADSASAIGESASVATVIFGDSAQQVIDFSEEAAAAIGQSQAAALSAAGDFGTFGKAAGLTGDELANFSTELVTLTSDAASFKNTTPQEAVEAFGAALRGESEPIRRYGVLLDEASVANAAYAAGIAAPGAELTQQQKILGRYQAILAQTTDLQGDFARTVGESVPNQLRVASASIDDFQAKIGQAVIPALSSVLTGLTPILEDLTEPITAFVGSFAEAYANAAPGIEKAIGAIGDAFGELAPIFPVLGELASVIAGSLADALTELVDSGALQDIVEGFAALVVAVTPLVPVVVKLASLIDRVLLSAIATAARAFSAAAKIFLGTLANLTGGLSRVLSIANLFADDLIPDGWIEQLGDVSIAAANGRKTLEELGRESQITDGIMEVLGNKVSTAALKITDASLGTKTSEGFKIVADAAKDVAKQTELAADAAEANSKRVVDAFTTGPSIADLVTEGASVQDAVKWSGRALDDLNKQAFGLATLRTKGFKDLLAEAVSIEDPKKAGEFIDAILSLPPERQRALEAAAAANSAAVAEAAKAVAAEQGTSIGVALGEATNLGLLSTSDSLVATGKAIGGAVGIGIAAGLDGTLTGVQRSAAAIADGLAERMRTKLEIRSPSKVFERIGEQVTAGLVAGLNPSAVGTQLDRMVPTTSASAAPPVSARTSDLVGAVAGGERSGGLTVQVLAPQIDPWLTGKQLAQSVTTELGLDGNGIQGRG